MERKLLALLLCILGSALLTAACADLSTLRADKPILPVQDYERLMVGNLEADYIGDQNCLRKCHVHDKIARDFEHSVHGEQISSESALPLVNCESCHGPGSLAVAHAEEKNVCDFKTLLPLEEFPAQAQSQLCLKCHAAASTPVLSHWSSSAHATGGVSCFDCHKLHQGPQQKATREEMAKLCYDCHQGVRTEFNQFSHHPLPELKMTCSDCHDPHGSTHPYDLKGATVRETCTRCHMEYQGPFVFEHADVTENCANCHQPHGSPNNPLLSSSQPFLCLQCHAGHLESHHPALIDAKFKAAFYTRCTDCHSTIHGTDVPSARGRGAFIAR